MGTHPARAGELIAPSAAGQQGSTTTKQKTGHRKDSGDPVYFYSEMKAPPALKERVTDGAGKPAGSELRWAGEAFRRINPTANAEPMILPFVNWQSLALAGESPATGSLATPINLALGKQAIFGR